METPITGIQQANASADAGADELLACLLIVARAHGGLPTAHAVMAGLPTTHARLTPSLFARAAQRVHLSSKVVRCPLQQLKDALLPTIVLLHGERACVLLGFTEDRSQARVVYPELGDAPTQVAVSALEKDYLGSAIYARPKQRFDARTEEVNTQRPGHWFWSVIAESVPLYRDVLLAALLTNIFSLAMPLFFRVIYDRVVPNLAFETLWVLSTGLLLVLLTDLGIRVMRSHFVDLASSRIDVKLSAYIMERVIGTRMEHRSASAGTLAANLKAFESVRDFIGSATVVAFIDLPFTFIFVIVAGTVSWLMLIPLAVGGGFMLLYALVVQARMQKLAETAYRAGAQRNSTLIEALVGFETIKAFAAESEIQRKWEQGSALLARVGAQLRVLSASATYVSAFVQQCISLSIVVVGVYLIAERELTMGAMIACTMLAARAMAPVGQVASLLVQFQTASTALASLNTIVAREMERRDGGAYLSRGHLKGAIAFRGVSFTYPGQSTPSLRNLTFSIQPGEKVAILGRVGSGKSTLQKMMMGLYQPTDGSVLVDGVDLRQLDPTELRRQIGYVQQDIMLFYGSLRENITLGAPLAEETAIIRAAKIAGLADLVNQHPQGFDMLIGERGESLSGGQRQGVAIARAVINDPPIMLLDEPTSSMDFTSEDDFKRRFIAFSPEKTVVLISHRTSMLDLVDRIIVMDGGRIMADGPKEQVVAALRQGRIGKAA